LDEVKDDTAEFLEILNKEIQNEDDIEKKLCFMDMRAEKTLGYSPEDPSKSDRANLKFIVFGGILGDHPPQDRAKDFREQNFKTIRNLGKVQMTTDTALLVSYEIMQQNKNFTDLKFVDDPEVSLEAEVHSFLDVKFTVDKLSEGLPMNTDDLIKEA
jgi:ribosome biogenesis SPOUT family RNA methylase Rps3